MKPGERLHRSADLERARNEDLAYFAINADLRRPIHPLDVETVSLDSPLWRQPMQALIPERDNILGQRLTYAQVTKNEIAQLFERVGMGGVNFGLSRRGDQAHEDAEIIPLRRDHLPQITPDLAMGIPAFRRDIEEVIANLGTAPIFLSSRSRILAAVQRPPEDRSAQREPWYAHLPIDLTPSPVYSEEHYRALWQDRSTAQNNADLSRPLIPMHYKGLRLEGPWTHQNVVAVCTDAQISWPQPVTLDQIAAMNMRGLLERLAFGGMHMQILDGDRRNYVGYLHGIGRSFAPMGDGSPLEEDLAKSLQTITPDNTVRAQEFWRDPQSIFFSIEPVLGKTIRFFRLENRVVAQLSRILEPRPIENS